MVPANHDHSVLLHKLEDEALHLHGFLPAVEQIAEDDQLVRLGIGEIPRLIQRRMKFSIKAVNIGGCSISYPQLKSTAFQVSV